MKILYLNHICWEWILQRPQIIELMLEQDFDCTVINKRFIFGKKLAQNNEKPGKEKTVYLLPKSEKSFFIRKLNDIIYSLFFHDAHKFDLIWVCHPLLFKFIPKNYKGIVVYDCMDNHVAMVQENMKNKVDKYQQELINRADIIFSSSERLKYTIKGMQNAVILRNGFRENMGIHSVKCAEKKERYIIAYFGTVSSWFDMQLLNDSINAFCNINYRIIGPIENGYRLAEDLSEKIDFKGIVEHSCLAQRVEDCDALIMPFVVNEIILSVDPVKLYEYISLGKCIISVWYPEIDRFSDFVYFYKSKEEYFELLEKLMENGFAPKYTNSDRKSFLQANSWEMRYLTIKHELESKQGND